jgi:hypothetical protein
MWDAMSPEKEPELQEVCVDATPSLDLRTLS